MKLKSILYVPAFALLASCSTSNIAVSDHLKQNSTVMDVKGNAGLLINQKISFGNFYTSSIKRGWTNRTELSVLGIKHEKAKQPIEFTQFGLNGSSAEIVGSNNFDNDMFKLFKGLQNYADHMWNGYFGVIMPKKNGPVWEVLIQNDNSGSSLKSDTDNGIAMDEEGNIIEIKGTKQLAEKKFLTDDSKTFGYELYRNGVSVGAVSVIGNGKVWIKKSLSEDDQLIVASLASILITKENLNQRKSQD